MDDKKRQIGEFEVNEEFADDLKKLYGPKGEVPARVDMAVLGAARRKLVRRRARWWKWAGAAVAASVLLVVMLNLERGQQEPAASSVAVMSELAGARIANDIDGNGRVDMLDALKVAKIVEAGRAEMRLDFNGDGVVDKRDIDAVAMAAVRLEKGA